jgi:hypothetical protein
VRWTAGGHPHSGHLTVELVDEALLGELPLLVFLHVNHPEPQLQRPMTLEPVAARILELAASGVTSVIARQVGLTVDGVNYTWDGSADGSTRPILSHWWPAPTCSDCSTPKSGHPRAPATNDSALAYCRLNRSHVRSRLGLSPRAFEK